MMSVGMTSFGDLKEGLLSKLIKLNSIINCILNLNRNDTLISKSQILTEESWK